MIITVDGPAGAGKSTVARLLARELKILYLDTGAMYRAVALRAKREGITPDAAERLKDLCARIRIRLEQEGGIHKIYLDDEDVSLAIRSPEMDMLSSRISAVAEVREAMGSLQRRIAQGTDMVAEGRDMGTVVFPDAAFKFFITASPQVRIERRYRERLGRGEQVSREDIEKDLLKRDEQDKNRSIAPLVQAADATVVDTSEMSPDQVIQRMAGIVKQASHEGTKRNE